MTAPTQNRLGFIDNLRWVMIVLVVSMHAAVTYSHMGSWYFMEDPKPDNLGTLFFFSYYQMGLQAFFMGLLFLIAGYFVPDAYDRKGQGRFLRDRAVRLCIPSLFYMLVVHPVIVFWLLRDYHKIAASFWSSYLEYFRSFRILGNSGPMWFTVALFVFCLVYSLVRKARCGAHANAPDAPLPTQPQVVSLILMMGLCTFLVRIVQPMGTNILNMQLCFFSGAARFHSSETGEVPRRHRAGDDHDLSGKLFCLPSNPALEARAVRKCGRSQTEPWNAWIDPVLTQTRHEKESPQPASRQQLVFGDKLLQS